MNQFFININIDCFVGVSKSSISKIKAKIRKVIEIYEEKYENKIRNSKEELFVILAADETFFQDVMLMVMMDLKSGYIMLEEEADNRKYDTWCERADQAVQKINAKVKGFVSDRYSGLVKLATRFFGVFHTPDIFHMSMEIVKTFGAHFARKLSALRKEIEDYSVEVAKEKDLQKYSITLLKEHSDEKNMQLDKELHELLSKEKTYKDELHRFSLAIHPFNIDNNIRQNSNEVKNTLEDIYKNLTELATSEGLKTDKIDKFARQIDEVSAVIDNWWKWVEESNPLKENDISEINWLINYLLPHVYWKNQIKKTSSKPIKKAYKKAYKDSNNQFKNHPRTNMLNSKEIDSLSKWASWMVSEFQRSSSAVEGRNGHLSQIHHEGRGMTKEQLKTLKTIHNFDTRGSDGKTPAERLSGQDFPDLLEYILENIGELPLPRKRKFTEKDKKEVIERIKKTPPPG